MKYCAGPPTTGQSDSPSPSEAMKYCSGNASAPASHASSALSEPNADGQRSADPKCRTPHPYAAASPPPCAA
eukprot:13992938-Alexandrium_andersonii.AAC.1